MKAAEKAEKEAIKAAEKAEKEAQREKEKAEKARKRAVKNVASAAIGSVGRELGKNVGDSVGGSLGKTIGGNGYSSNMNSNSGDDGRLKPNEIYEGMTVHHPRFGDGTVLKAEAVAGDALLTVDFDGMRKNMLAKSAGLTKA